MSKKTWYSIKAEGENGVLIDIFDEIGYWGISAKDFINDLKRHPDVKNIEVRINSYGGEVFDGVAIYNSLKRHPANVTVIVYGVAASIASIIAMAGDKVVMPENTYMFIHDPLAIVIGDADDMRDMADSLEKIAAGLVASYVAKTGKEEKEIKKWMADDTWFTAAEAKAAGLADEVTTAVKIAANATLARFKNLPDGLRPLATTEDPAEAARKSAKEILDLCAGAGVSDWAGELIAAGKSVDQVRDLLKDAKEIGTRCAAAKMPELAANYIKAGLSPDEVGSNLLARKVALDPEHIDSRLGTGDGKTKKETAIDVRAINARYQRKQ